MNWQETAAVVVLFTLRIIVPLIVTLSIGEFISRLYKARQRQQQPVPVQAWEEAEAIIQGRYELAPPCWEVKNCDPILRESCPAYLRPNIPCWLALQVAGHDLPEECFACEIFQRSQPVTAGETLTMVQGG